MSSFVNFLKNLFSGLFSFVSGLFGSKKAKAAISEAEPKTRKAKNSGYFLELDEAKGIGNGATAPAKTPVAAAAKSQAVKDSAKPEPAKVEAAKPKQAAKAKAAATAEKAEPKPAAAKAALNLPQPTVTTFAPKYLAPTSSSNGRRRPGANMSSFLDMARQVKTSS
ncbi:MAG: hypothetical protein KME45_00020 [Stenomitos rutilans HA7619-LM2]|jgi:uncharacterized membrane protein|nr:hypothetical protein [Stenomitos rutilans HA7619-LM2]